MVQALLMEIVYCCLEVRASTWAEMVGDFINTNNVVFIVINQSLSNAFQTNTHCFLLLVFLHRKVNRVGRGES